MPTCHRIHKLAYLPALGCFFMVNVGQYTSPMDPMGMDMGFKNMVTSKFDIY